MCLDINIDDKAIIAEEDIVCYKRIIFAKAIRIDYADLHGKEFQGVINGKECEGKINVEENKIFFCTNHNSLCGSYCRERFGYKNSWEFDMKVISIVVDGVELMTGGYLTPYQKFPIELGVTYHSKLIKIQNGIYIGLHSFVKLKDAYEDSDVSVTNVFIECIIPKGSTYYLGNFNESPSYASDCIKYVKLIEK